MTSEETLTKERYEATLKKVTSKKEEQFGMIHMSWNLRDIILPYKQAVQFMELLEHAQKYTAKYKETPALGYLNRDDITLACMPEAELKDIKVAIMLNVSVEEIRSLKEKE